MLQFLRTIRSKADSSPQYRAPWPLFFPLHEISRPSSSERTSCTAQALLADYQSFIRRCAWSDKLLFDDRKTEATVGCRTLRCHALPARTLSCRLVIKISFVNGFLGLPDNVDRHKTLYTCAHRAGANCIGLPFSSTPTWQCSRRRISGAKLARLVPRSKKFDEASTSARDRRCRPTVAEVSFKS